MKRPTFFCMASLCLGLALVPPVFARDESARSFRGTVEMVTLPSGNVQLALDERTESGSVDGLADHLFILEREVRAVPTHLSLADATVTYTSGKLTLRYDAGKELRWRLSDGDSIDQLASDRPLLYGTGLSYHRGDFDKSAADLATASFYDSGEGDVLHIPPDGGGNVYCDAGGAGATKCSILCTTGTRRQCEVECSSNKYACCNCFSSGANCKCHKNTGS